jgi:hypothetical protein
MTRCDTCGAAIAPADRFCPDCGITVTVLQSSPAVVAPHVAAVGPTGRPMALPGREEQVIRDWPVIIAAEANAINEAKRQRKALNAGVKVYKVFADKSRELVNNYPSLARSNP